MPQEVSLSPEQQAQYENSPTAGQEVQLTPDQQAAFDQPQSKEVDPLKDFTSEQIFQLSKQDPEFRILEQFSSRPDLQKDPWMVSKVADALHKQKLEPWYRGISASGMAKGIAGFGKGAFTQASDVAQNAADSISLGLGHLLGADPGTLDQLGRNIQQRVAESTSATEAATTGLVGQAVRLAKKVGGKPLDQYTEQDKVNSLFDSLADLQQQQKIATGHGALLSAVGPEVVKNLEQQGSAVRPEQVASLAQADPFAFEAMGKGLAPVGKAAGALVPESAAALAQKAAQATIGRGVQAVGALVKPVATAVRAVAPGVSKAAGAAAGAVAAGELNPAAIPLGIMEGLEKGGKLGEKIATGAGKVAGSFDQLSEIGRQIAGAAPLKSSLAVVGRQVAEAAPRAAGAALAGAGFDIGLQAGTAETPEERESFTPFGTIFGLAHGVKYAGTHTISGLISAPREWGSNIRTPNSKNFPGLNSVHDAGYDSASPGVKSRVNALRQLVEGTGAELFYAPRPEQGQPDNLPDTLTGMGIPADRADTFADKAAFTTTINGKKVVVIRNVEAGPHDALHAIDDVVGATQVRELNDAVKGQYTPEVWSQMRQRYADLLAPGTDNPTATILDQTGRGDAEAKEKIIRQVHDTFTQNNETPDMESFKQAAGSEIQRQQSDAAAAGKSLWEHTLTPEEQNNVADQYMGSEVRAENFDSAYKGIGDGKTLTDKLAHAVAGTMASLGFNPVAGRYSDLGFPLDYATMKQGLKQSAVNKPLVSPSKLPKVVAPVGSPAAATQQQKRHEEIVKTAPDVALPGAAKSPREMMGILNEAVLSGSPVDIHYGHAGGTAPAAGTGDLPEAALGGVSRADRREVIEAWRQLPIATRSFMATLFSPERFDVTKGGKYQVYGGSHAVLAANLQKLANFSIAHPEVKLPDGWNVDDKSFTPDSWNTILDQVQKYSRNQLTGRAGSGQPLVVPKMKGYFAPPVTGEAAVIPQDAADAINAVFGQTTPATARIMKKDVVPLNLAGQRIAEATLPGRVEAPTAESPEFEGETAKGLGIEGQHVLEPNPFLQELNKFSDAPSFIEARRRLNLEHMADVEHAPAGSPSLRGNTLTMAAGFRPELLPDKENVGRWSRFSHLVGMWLSPDGDFYDATPTHYHSAEKYITGVTKEDPRELAYKKQWVRVNIDGGSADAQILIEGPKPNPTQMRALDSAAESQGLPVNNDSGRTVIEAPAGFRPELRGNEDIQQVADRYMKATGRPYTRPTAATPLNEAVAKRIADFYQSAAHSPDSPEVQSSYKAMADETVQQWNALEKAGYKMEPWTKPGQPYGSSAEMTADVRDNHHLWFFPTEAGYGTGTEIAKHPLLEDSGVQVNGRELPYNDVFRAVHDVMGHAKEGYEFGPKGELNAYLAHSAMYSDAAKPAMASETLGQNSWVNFGEHLRTPEGNIPKKGEAGFVPAPERPFAEQKAFLLPENLQKLSLDDESAQFKPRKRKDDWQLKEGPGMFSKAWIAPDGKPIQLGGQWHHEWVNENPDVAEKYGLKPTTSGEENRSEALQKGFARVNYEKNTGTFKVEARQQDWDKLSPSVLEMVKRNLGKIDNMDVHLLDAKGKNIVDQDGVALHTYDAGEKLDHIPLISEPSSTVTETSPQATGKAESAQFRPADEDTQILYSGKGGGVGSGEGGSWWTSSLRRAISFGPSVSRVEVPKEIAQAAREAALKQGSGTSTDFVLPNEWVKKAEPVGELDQPTYELPIQFRPDETNPRAVKMAALRDEDTGKIYEGPMHAFAKLEYLKEKYASRLDENGDLPDNLMLQAWKADPNLSEGFTTNAGEFLSRDEAKDRAVELKQYVAKPNEGSSLESQAFTRQQELQKAGYAPDVQYRPSAKPEDFKSEETLPRALQSPNWAIFTATKEDLGPGTNEHNELRNENLEKALVADGFTPTEVSGNYKGVDQGKSFLVPNMTPEQATAWGNKYGQESVLTPHGILYGDGTINPADHSKTVVGPEAEKQDFYSKLKDGPAFSMGIDTDKRVQFKPNTPEERDLLGAAIAPQAFSKAEVMAMSNKDLLEHYPEAVVPNKVRNKKGKLVEPELTSDIVHAPLVEANGGAESPKAIKAYAQKVVDFAKQWQDHPAFKDGMKWYSDFVPKLKANFGKNAQLFAELLAATSPNTTPDVNFGFAYDALKSFETGKFDQQIAKFNEGMKMADEDNWQDWYNKNVPESDRPVKPTKATFMAEWIDQHDLAPRQSNGKNYGMHSVPVLQVLARRWLNQTTGPKTQNFIKNLVGSEHEATIDVWADRTMRRLGYQDYQDRWRILPKNATGVPDTDFHFSQKVFRAAANQMDIKPDALQGALWFAEKQLWADKGWGRLDLGDYRKEMAKVPELQKRFEQRNAQQEMNLVAPRPGVQYNPGMKLVKATVQDKNGGILIGGGKSITSSPLTPVDASAWADAIISNQIGLPASQYGTKDQRRNKDDFKVTIR